MATEATITANSISRDQRFGWPLSITGWQLWDARRESGREKRYDGGTCSNWAARGRSHSPVCRCYQLAGVAFGSRRHVGKRKIAAKWPGEHAPLDSGVSRRRGPSFTGRWCPDCTGIEQLDSFVALEIGDV